MPTVKITSPGSAVYGENGITYEHDAIVEVSDLEADVFLASDLAVAVEPEPKAKTKAKPVTPVADVADAATVDATA